MSDRIPVLVSRQPHHYPAPGHLIRAQTTPMHGASHSNDLLFSDNGLKRTTSPGPNGPLLYSNQQSGASSYSTTPMDITPSTTPPLVVNGVSLTGGSMLSKPAPQQQQQPLPPRSAPSIAPSTTTTIATSSSSNSTVSLYQTCIALRDRLQGVHDFQHFLELTEKPNSNDPASDHDHLDTLDLDVVSHLWRCFMLGPSLCCIYNAMNPNKPLDVNYDCTLADLKECKKAVYHFLVAIRGIVPESKLFTISDLYNNNTNGIVKVVPQTCFD